MNLLSRQRARGLEGGAATVLVVSVVGLVLVLTLAGLVLASVVLASHRARLAVDLGSLAGAAAIQDGLSPASACAVAQRVSGANGAAAQGCSVSGETLDLRVAVRAALWPEPASAHGRAGPQR
ncbi:Rv3654c family TadE-like protein [Terrabacter sp. NPDC080008]|uniref:Rv3654c family TadE-like protein n=1 Tax=Terrabacter sp. NPDC080008 TaxID=3155176 RepID=UPI00344EFFDE